MRVYALDAGQARKSLSRVDGAVMGRAPKRASCVALAHWRPLAGEWTAQALPAADRHLRLQGEHRQREAPSEPGLRSSGEKVKKLRLVARALVDNAIDGDTTAVRECFDRMDGKVTQGVDATDQVPGDITFTWTPPAD
jgi:hypothetical protein